MADEPQANPSDETKPEETAAPTPPAEPVDDRPHFTRSQLANMTPAEYQENRAAILAASNLGRITDDISGARRG